ncbi:hypothetical protein WME77_23335 [Sorangium sp. So ce764]|uniref:hypothetical protein n=1 Tax=Sorangium sp. So ce764 TaxID=3133320 RepID=UPI003F5D82E0
MTRDKKQSDADVQQTTLSHDGAKIGKGEGSDEEGRREGTLNRALSSARRTATPEEERLPASDEALAGTSRRPSRDGLGRARLPLQRFMQRTNFEALSTRESPLACGRFLRVGAILLFCNVALLTASGCTIKIGPGTEDKAANSAADEDDKPFPDDVKTPEERADESYAQIDPNELALASQKAGFVTTYLVGATEALGLDPMTLDEAALVELLQQAMPLAAEEANRWLATLDPAASELSFFIKWECGREGCKNPTPCAYFPPPVDHYCYVDDCGSAACRNCPEWVAERLKGLVWKTWCSYVCIEVNTSPPKVVATGAGAVSAFKGNFVGPLCFPQ